MKRICWTTLLLLSIGINGFSQEVDEPVSGSLPLTESERIAENARRAWQVTARQASSTEWRRTEVVTNFLGQLEEQTRGYTEIASGLNYLDERGTWQASIDAIELMTNSGGAAALYGPTKVYFPPSLGGGSGIRMLTANKVAINLQPLALYYFDAESGKSVLLGSIREAEGELIPPNTVVYRSVIKGLKCDLRYTYNKGAFESDLIILESPKPPSAYGLSDETSRLELWHLAEGPAPGRQISRVLKGETDPAKRARMVDPDLIDETLDFGDVWFPQGYAFSTPDATEEALPPSKPRRAGMQETLSGAPRVPVAKRWGEIGGKAGLVESVYWSDIAPELEKLPPKGRSASSSGSERRARLQRELPELVEVEGASRTMRIASADYQPGGYVLDYTTVPASGSYSFASGQTYFISSASSFCGVTFNAGCIIKYANNACLTVCGSLVSSGTNGNESILTCKDDDAYGQKIAGSTGEPTYAALPAISLYWAGGNVTLNGMKIRWAKRAITAADTSYYARSHTLADSYLQFCQEGVYADHCSFVFQTVKQCSVTTLTTCNLCSISGIPSAACGGDEDSDGLADVWEIHYFGSTQPLPSEDPDADGLNNEQEETNGTNPLVQDTPKILVQPQSQTVLQGGTASFSVTAAGTGTLTYEWYKNGTQIPGATSSVWDKSGAQLSDCANYSVVVHNAYGSTPSANAFLSVAVPTSGTPTPSGLVAWWEGETNCNDTVGVNHGINFGVDFLSGEVGSAFNLQGGSDHVQATNDPANPALRLSTGATFEAWVYPTTSSSQLTVLSKWDTIGGYNQCSYAFLIYPGGTFGLGACWDGRPNNTAYANSSSNVPTNQWSHLAGTYDGTALRVYLNGTLKGTTPHTAGIFPSSCDFTIGGVAGQPSTFLCPFVGLLDEVSVYNRALSGTEIQAICAAAGAGKYSPPPPPTIAVQPQSTTVVPGSSTTFTVAATGATPFNYQWTFNGSAVAGATTSSHTINSVQSTDAGTYAVVIANSGGSVLSAGAQLIVSGSPVCATLPSGVVAWWRAENDYNDTIGANNGGNYSVNCVPGEVGSAFNLEGGNDHVQVPNDPAKPALRLSTAATFEAWVNPTASGSQLTILSKWDTIWGYNQRSYCFAINPDGTFGIAVCWDGTAYNTAGANSSNVVPLNEWSHLAGTYDGAALRVYWNGTLKGTTPYTAGIFPSTCDFTIGGAAGQPSVFICPFIGRLDEVTVYNRALSQIEIQAIYDAGSSGKCLCTPPTITTQPQSQVADAGASVTFSIAASGTAPLSYQWLKNGSTISGATSASYTKSSVQASDAATYSVLVSNAGGSATSEGANLAVITSQPQSQTVNQGATASFGVTVASPTSVSYQWRLNTVNVGANNSTFTKNNVETTDAGNYDVLIASSGANCLSQSASLTVVIPPSIITDPSSQQVLAGSDATFTVAATGGSLNYQWNFNGQDIPGAISTSYTRTDLLRSDAGLYNVRVSNSGGTAVSQPANLTVTDSALAQCWFDGSPWVIEPNQSPHLTANLSAASSWNGDASSCKINNASAAKLVYNISSGGNPNITCRRGTLRFWFRPEWSSTACGGIGPGNKAVLVRVGPDWELALDAAGDHLSFTSKGGGIQDTLITTSVSWKVGNWHQICLTYDPALTLLYIDGEIQATAAGIQHFPDANTRNNNRLSIGSDGDATGLLQARGRFEDLETFTYPLSAQVVRNDYHAIHNRDTDGDGLPDVTEDELGTLRSNPDSDGDGIPDGWEHAQGLNPMFAADAEANPDDDQNLDGSPYTNYQEYQKGTDPHIKDYPDESTTFNEAGTKSDIINVDFTSNGSQTMGPAAAGFDATDAWNVYSDAHFGSGEAFQRGLTLNHAGGSPKATLWAMAGPYWLKLQHRVVWICDNPRVYDWPRFWCCWAQILGTVLPFESGTPGGSAQSIQAVQATTGVTEPLYWYDWNAMYCGLGLPTSWWNKYRWRLPEPNELPVWVAAFDTPGKAGSGSGVDLMATDTLTSRAQAAPRTSTWLDACSTNSASYPVRLWLTGLNGQGLAPGNYQVYLYGATPAQVNGDSGEDFPWHLDPNDPSSVRTCRRYSVTVPGYKLTAGALPPANPSGGTVSPSKEVLQEAPIWIPRSDWFDHPVVDGIEIGFAGPAEGFESPAELAGMQIVAISPPQPPSQVHAVAAKQTVYLSWSKVSSATSYLVHRTAPANRTAVFLTGDCGYADAGLAPGTYSYYVVAISGSLRSGPSQTVSATVSPDGPYNSAPTLNTIGPVKLHAQPGGTFRIPFAKVLAASDASDPDRDPISFKIEGTLNGELNINGVPFSVNNCTFDSNADVEWIPAGEVPNTGKPVFRVRAFDGFLHSGTAVNVTLVPMPKSHAFGWGANYYGTLGNGENFSPCDGSHVQLDPSRVKLDPDLDFDIVRHAPDCVGAAVASDGTLWMWGREVGTGRFGEGQPSFYDTDAQGNFLVYDEVILPEPFKVQTNNAQGTLEDFNDVRDVSVGFYHVLATRSDGSLWSWGQNWFNVLGYEPNSQDCIEYIYGWIPTTKKARQVKGIVDASGRDLPVIQTVADYASSLALCADGSVWWWGTLDTYRVVPPLPGSSGNDYQNEYRFLTEPGGDPSLPNRQTSFDGGPKVVQIAGDSNHFLALKEDGTVWEFGYIPRLVVAEPNSDPSCGSYCYVRETPAQVPDLPPGIKVVSITTTLDYSLALLEDRTVYAWGMLENWKAAKPTKVPSLENIVKIDSKFGFVMAVDSEGNIWGWGEVRRGQLGRDESGSFSEPQPIFGVENTIDVISGGDASAFAIGTLEAGKPTGLIATALNASVQLNWQPYAGASGYYIYRYDQQSGQFVRIHETSDNAFKDTGLVNGIVYSYKVSALVDNVESPQSRAATAVPLDPPIAPQWISVDAVRAGCSSIRLSWQPVVGASSYNIYRVDIGAGEHQLISKDPQSTDFVDRTAQAARLYSYCVTAVNSAGEGPASQNTIPKSLRVSPCPPTPQSVTLNLGETDGHVLVSWTIVKEGDDFPEGYRLKWYYGKKQLLSTATFIHKYIPAETANIVQENGNMRTHSYLMGNAVEDADGHGGTLLPPDEPVWFEVSAVLNDEEGADSAIQGPVVPCASCLPSIPSITVAQGGWQQVYLEWADDPKAAYFRVEYSDNGGAMWQFTPEAEIKEPRFWHLGRASSTTYKYRVTAYSKRLKTDGTTLVVAAGPSASAEATTLSSQPTTFSFTAQADAFDRMLYVHWESESLGNPPQYRFFVERKTGADPYVLVSATDYGLAYLDHDVANETTYTYRVTALDANYHVLARPEVTATPRASGLLTLLPLSAGNGHVDLSWNALTYAAVYQIKHSLHSNGPFEVATTLGSDASSFTHTGLQNGVNHYYMVTAITRDKLEVHSNIQMATPQADLKPLPPTNLRADIVLDGSQAQVRLSWSHSAGATGYEVSAPAGWGSYSGDKTSCSLPVPAGTADQSQLTFKVRASAEGQWSSWRQATIIYAQPTSGEAGNVLLSIAGASDYPLVVTGPTNLVLHASVKAEDANEVQVFFYDTCSGNRTLIGTAVGREAQITWFQVPKGNHTVVAEAVIQSAISTAGTKMYTSSTKDVEVKMVPELATYQTTVLDLQLPAPGLPIVLSRSYDSRRTTANGALGKGWTASWDEPSLTIASPLADDWSQAGYDFMNNQYHIVGSASHLVTVVLPGGATVYFDAALPVPPGLDPRWDNSVSLAFNPFAPNQGTLKCQAGTEGMTRLNVVDIDGEDLVDWGTDAIKLRGGEDDYIPSQFTYTAPDATAYEFEKIECSWKLTKIIDRNGNSLTYSYTDGKLARIAHSNGRAVEFGRARGSAYDADGAVINGVWLSVYDSFKPKSSEQPVLKYFIQDAAPNDQTPAFLKEITRLKERDSSDWENTKLVYGTTGASQDRLTDIYDARGVRVVRNVYTVLSDGISLDEQYDALNTKTDFDLVGNNLTITKADGTDAQEAVTVGHHDSGAITSAEGAAITSYTYDERGRVISQTTDGKTKAIEYDSQDRPAKQIDELGNTTSTTFDRLSNPESVTDAKGNTSTFEYDDKGNLQVSSDLAGVRTKYTYTGVSSGGVILAGGLVDVEKKDAPGVIYQDASGVIYKMELVRDYDYFPQSSPAKGELSKVTEKWVKPDNTVPDENQVHVTETSYTYDANGNRTTETKTRTLTSGIQTIITAYGYDAQNRVRTTTITGSGGENFMAQTTTTTYNKIGKAAITTDAFNREAKYTYDVLGNLIETEYPDGSVTRTTYDQQDRVVYTQERARPDPALEDKTTAPATRNFYDQHGRIERVERRSAVELKKEQHTGFQGLVSADPQYKITEVAEGQVQSTTRTFYDLNAGRVNFTVDARGTVTGFAYDYAGRRTSVKVFKDYMYPGTGTPDVTGKAYDETKYGYDANGNQVWVEDALHHRTDYTFDKANRVTLVVFPQVGAEPRRTRKTDYDGLGQRLRETDEAGVATDYRYDFRGLLTSVKLDATGTPVTTSYQYDELGNLIAQTDARDNTTRFAYDAIGRRTKRLLPGVGEDWSDMINGQPNPRLEKTVYSLQHKEVRDFRGRTLVFDYDGADRVMTVTPSATDSTGQGIDLSERTTVDFVYTAAGLPAKVVQSGGTVRTVCYAYDNAGRLRVKETPEGTLTYNYDAAGTVTRISARYDYTGWDAEPLHRFEELTASSADTSRAEWNYRYDSFGRLKKVNPDTTAEDSPADATYTYDAVGNVQSTVYRNGVRSSYTYNERNWLRMLETSKSGVFARFDYDSAAAGANWPANRRLSPTGQRCQVTDLIGSASRTVTYDYDGLYRLLKEEIAGSGPTGVIDYNRADASYTWEGYDPVGNRQSRKVTGSVATSGVPEVLGSTFDERDQLAGVTCDNNGNTTANGTDTYAYEAENRLVRCQTIINGQPTTITLAYDADGNRVERTVGTTSTFYLVDDRNPTGYAQVIEERSAPSANPGVKYVYGLDLVSQDRSGDVSYYGYDGLGSVRYLTDGTTGSPTYGQVTDTYTYDAFGVLIDRKVRRTSDGMLVSFADPSSETAPAGTTSTLNSYRYTGEQWDPDLGMYYLRARYYKPNTGRFWTMDTYEGSTSDPGSLHKYLYCRGDGINRIDPSGHDDISTIMCNLGIRAWGYAQTIAPVLRVARFALATVTLASFVADVEFRQAYVSSLGGPGSAATMLAADIRFISTTSSGLVRAATAKNIVTLRLNTGDPNDFRVKTADLKRAANAGGLTVVSNPSQIRDASAQAAYRRAVLVRYTRYLQQLGMSAGEAEAQATKKFSTLHADHRIDLQGSGSLNNPNDTSNLRMLDGSVNTSVGKQLANEIERLGLQTGDQIDDVEVIGQ